MKTLIVIISLFCTPFAYSGGDLIGGGNMKTIKQTFLLDQKSKDQLYEQGEIQKVYETWMKSMSKSQKQKIINNVFKELIAPQILEKKGSIFDPDLKLNGDPDEVQEFEEAHEDEDFS